MFSDLWHTVWANFEKNPLSSRGSNSDLNLCYTPIKVQIKGKSKRELIAIFSRYDVITTGKVLLLLSMTNLLKKLAILITDCSNAY